MRRKIRSTRNARNTVMNQFHKIGDEKSTPVIIPAENLAQSLAADIPTATQMLSCLLYKQRLIRRRLKRIGSIPYLLI